MVKIKCDADGCDNIAVARAECESDRERSRFLCDVCLAMAKQVTSGILVITPISTFVADMVSESGQDQLPTRLVLIRWVDSARCSPDWQYLADREPDEPVACLSVGWVLSENTTCITIVPTMSVARKQSCGGMCIPTEAIKSIVDLAEEPA